VHSTIRVMMSALNSCWRVSSSPYKHMGRSAYTPDVWYQWCTCIYKEAAPSKQTAAGAKLPNGAAYFFYIIVINKDEATALTGYANDCKHMNHAMKVPSLTYLTKPCNKCCTCHLGFVFTAFDHVYQHGKTATEQNFRSEVRRPERTRQQTVHRP
jgi:hypothetical protein